jgi:hypothetical protein
MDGASRIALHTKLSSVHHHQVPCDLGEAAAAALAAHRKPQGKELLFNHINFNTEGAPHCNTHH